MTNKKRFGQIALLILMIPVLILACSLSTPEPTPIPTETPIPGPPRISWDEARSYIGQEVTVCGEVFTVAVLLDGRTVVNVGALPDSGGVIVVIEDSNLYDEDFTIGLYGDDACATGELVLDGGNVGMYISEAGLIELDQ